MPNSTMIFDFIIRFLQTHLKDVVNEKNRPQYKFFFDMVFGILKSSSIVLNDIAHALNEKITLKKTNYRLQRNLTSQIDVAIKHSFIKTALGYMNNDDLVFLIDDSDIIKPYGKHFEKLATVRDGSAPKQSLQNGYHVSSITGLSRYHKHPIPFITTIYSSITKKFKSANVETYQNLLMILAHLKPFTATFVFDRGYDNHKLMQFIHNNNQYFVIRMSNNRRFMYKNQSVMLKDAANKRKGKIVVPLRYKGKDTSLKLSFMIGKINNFIPPITALFSYLGAQTKDPMILLTNKIVNTKEEAIDVSLHYVSRWKIEELFRFKKVDFSFENFRVKSLTAINNLSFHLDIAIFMLAAIIETQKRNMIYNELINRSKRIRTDAYLTYYQVNSGIKTLFTRNKKGVKNYQQIERWEKEPYSLFNSKELTDNKMRRKPKAKKKKKAKKKQH